MFYKIGMFLVNILSIKQAYRFGIFISDLQYLFSPRDRKAVRNNLISITESEENIKFQTREIFRNFGRYLVEFFKIQTKVDADFLKDHVEVEGEEHLKEVLAQEKGGVILSAHIGNWEMGAVIISMLGYPLDVVALQHKERPVNQLFNLQRQSKGVGVIPADDAVKQTLRAFRNNKLVALLGDRDFFNRGIPMTFLGKKVIIPKGPGLFCYKYQTPLIPTFSLRKENGSFKMIFLNPIYPPKKSKSIDSKLAIEKIMVEYLSIIEAKIKENPTQWLMFRKYWIDE